MDYIDKLYLKEVHDSKKVLTSILIPSNASILKFKGELLSEPNKYSIQIDRLLHLDRGFEVDDELNHSCTPNCRIDFKTLILKSLREIQPNEELTINYCSTEEFLSNPFECECKSKNCYTLVRGFYYLNDMQREQIKELLSPYLLNKYYKH